MRQARVLEYADGTAYQVEGAAGSLVATYRRPQAHERAVQYWRHRWSSGPVRTVELRAFKGAEGERAVQLLAPDEKTSVIFDQRTGVVREVVEYGR
ncbi:MAG: hypothetical protein IT285_15580 [Bdellovibrionales bacterium]|nr:hypothetical protein [Bdellovibrionales bacterium]